MCYRAPEILCGCEAFGLPVDLWACGLTLAECGGGNFHKWTGAVKTWSVITFLMALLRQLGTPEGSVCQAWPLWPKEHPNFRRQPWPAPVEASLGTAGVALLTRLLSWQPAGRPSAAEALEDAYFHPERFHLGGCLAGPLPTTDRLRPWVGHRHPWRILCGQMSPEVLGWIQGDPALQPGTPEWSALGVAFTGRGPKTKTELDAKFVLAGHLGERPRSSQLCGLSLAAALPVPRLQAWFRAFLDVNTDGLGQQPICRSFLVLCCGVFLKFSARGPVRPVLCSPSYGF